MDLAKQFMLIALRARAARIGGSAGIALERFAAEIELAPDFVDRVADMLVADLLGGHAQ